MHPEPAWFFLNGGLLEPETCRYQGSTVKTVISLLNYTLKDVYKDVKSGYF
jgi:hypothetical protein